MNFNDQLTNDITPLYTKYATNLLYKGETSEETGTIPTVSKEGFAFDGWFTEGSGGKKVVNFQKQLVTDTVEGFVQGGK